MRLTTFSINIRRSFHKSRFLLNQSTIFDDSCREWHKLRATFDPKLSREVDYLRAEIGNRLADRVKVIKRKFPYLLDYNSGPGFIHRELDEECCDKIILTDTCDNESEIPIERIKLNALNEIPFKNNEVPGILSNLSLHWINDLLGSLTNIKDKLVPDGLFLGAMIGGDSLFELRTSLQLAEIERGGGLSARVSPFAESKDIANLLTRAGLTLTTVDVDEIVVNYPTMFHLMEDLNAMGESNAVMNRQPFLKRDTLLAASAIYQACHGNEDGSIPATFQVIYMIGWKPDASQPKPLKRGSGKTNLKEVIS